VDRGRCWCVFCCGELWFCLTLNSTLSVWINDYHLMLLPLLLRQSTRIPALACAPIGFFMHVAFPSSEIFRWVAIPIRVCVGVSDVNWTLNLLRCTSPSCITLPSKLLVTLIPTPQMPKRTRTPPPRYARCGSCRISDCELCKAF
jgi:hypothetical protein